MGLCVVFVCCDCLFVVCLLLCLLLFVCCCVCCVCCCVVFVVVLCLFVCGLCLLLMLATHQLSLLQFVSDQNKPCKDEQSSRVGFKWSLIVVGNVERVSPVVGEL